jgi:hypothetical protein
MGMPSIVIDAAPAPTQIAPSLTGWKAVVLVAVVGGPTLLDGVVTPGFGLLAPVVGVVLAALAGVVLAVAG